MATLLSDNKTWRVRYDLNRCSLWTVVLYIRSCWKIRSNARHCLLNAHNKSGRKYFIVSHTVSTTYTLFSYSSSGRCFLFPCKLRKKKLYVFPSGHEIYCLWSAEEQHKKRTVILILTFKSSTPLSTCNYFNSFLLKFLVQYYRWARTTFQIQTAVS